MKKIYWISIAIGLLVTVMMEIIFPHYEHWWNSIPGFYILLGWGGALLLTAIKFIAKLFILKKENYYNE